MPVYMLEIPPNLFGLPTYKIKHYIPIDYTFIEPYVSGLMGCRHTICAMCDNEYIKYYIIKLFDYV